MIASVRESAQAERERVWRWRCKRGPVDGLREQRFVRVNGRRRAEEESEGVRARDDGLGAERERCLEGR